MSAVVVMAGTRAKGRAAAHGRRVPGGALAWIGGVMLALFLVLAVVMPFFLGSPTARVGLPLQGPSAAHLFGTDNLGRDLLTRTAAGARLSLIVSVTSVALGLVLAVPAGMFAGFHGGRWLDEMVMRLLDALQAMPLFVLALFVLGMLGTQTSHLGPVTVGAAVKVVLLLGVSFIPYFARVARAATLVEMQEDYVDGLRAIGVSRTRIVFGELLPNVLPPVLVQAFLWVGVAIFAESALSFLGLGIQPPQPSLGNILGDATNYMILGAWWFSIMPGLVILLATVGVNLVGDGFAATVGRRH